MQVYLDIENYYFKLNWIKDDREFCLINKEINIDTKKIVRIYNFKPLQLKVKLYPKDVFSQICVVNSETGDLEEKQVMNTTYLYNYETDNNGKNYIKKSKNISNRIEYSIYSMDYDKMLLQLKNDLKKDFKNYIKIYNKLIKNK